jgi:hypothetical protein
MAFHHKQSGRWHETQYMPIGGKGQMAAITTAL